MAVGISEQERWNSLSPRVPACTEYRAQGYCIVSGISRNGSYTQRLQEMDNGRPVMSKIFITNPLFLMLLAGCASEISLNNNPGNPGPGNTAPGAINVFTTDGNGGRVVAGDKVSEASFPQPFDSAAGYSNEIYVDASATMNGIGTQVQPLDNIPDAITAARNAGSGSRIHIAAGTYPAVGSHADLQGQADAPIALVAVGNVTIDAGNSGTGMHLKNARYVVIDGLTIQNTGIHGLSIDDGGDYSTPAEYIVLRNMHFRNNGSGGNNDCLKLSGVDNFYIEDSEFEGCNQGEAIDMVGCHNGVITANHFHDVISNGVQTKGGSSDILIHGNRFIDMPVRAINAGGNTGDPYFRPITASYEAENITIVANLFLRTGQSAVVYSGCNSCIVANNTIIEPNSSVFWAVEEKASKGPGQNGYFINNIVVFNNADLSEFSFFNSNGQSLVDTFTVDGNLWFARDNAAFSVVPNGYGFPMGANGIIQDDPMLDVNYRLTSGSPAIAQGIPIPGGVTFNFDGIAYSIPPSIGAFSAP